MNNYQIAKLNDHQVQKLNEYQKQFSEELGKDIILIAHNDDHNEK
ncbi:MULTISPECIES: hypothetical protein [Bacillaceae]|nr:hypothetical protein [Bacillus sp. FJAT-27916]